MSNRFRVLYNNQGGIDWVVVIGYGFLALFCLATLIWGGGTPS